MRIRTMVGAAAMAAAGALLAAPASADTPPPDYAGHVTTCQEAMGFSGTHNPGVMHRGYSGWHAGHECAPH